MYDITLLTDSRWVNPKEITPYSQNVLLEDNLVIDALERKGLTIHRTNWDDKNFDWSTTEYALFRATWDYFERYAEFKNWLVQTSKLTHFINPFDTLIWNLDKRYLKDLQEKDVNIPNTIFIEAGDKRSLVEAFESSGWKEAILKPAIGGGAYNTYRLNTENVREYESVFLKLIGVESMLLQEFQHSVLSKGEISLMCFGGKYNHSILKKGKGDDFRVQDDFGGSVHDYRASDDEIRFAEKVLEACPYDPVYARVDVLWDNNNNLTLGELELIEPELWFRNDNKAADKMADAIYNYIAP